MLRFLLYNDVYTFDGERSRLNVLEDDQVVVVTRVIAPNWLGRLLFQKPITATFAAVAQWTTWYCLEESREALAREEERAKNAVRVADLRKRIGQ